MRTDEANAQEEDQEEEEPLEEPHYAFKGIWVPVEALLCPDLGVRSQLLFGLMNSFPDFKSKGMWASNKYLAAHLQVSEQTITNCLKELRETGFIEDKGAKNRASRQFSRIAYSHGHKKSYDQVIRNLMTLLDRKRRSKRSSSEAEEDLEPPQRAEVVQAHKESSLPPERKKVCHPLLEYWNNSTGEHPRHTDPSSQVYRRSWELMKMFLDGEVKKLLPMSKDWLDTHKIPESFYSKSFTRKEIETGLDGLIKLYLPEYWPRKKEALPKSLQDLVYNYRTRKSMLLLVMFKGGDLGKWTTHQESEAAANVGPLEERVIDIVRQLSTEQETNKNLLAISAVKRIQEWMAKCQNSLYLGGVMEVLERYHEFLLQRDADKLKGKISLLKFGPGSSIWERFVSEEKGLGMFDGVAE